MAAYALCKSIGLNDEDLDKALNQNKKTSKRGKVLSLDGRNLTMLETKNENNLS